MWEWVISFCQWLESLSVPTWIRNTLWGYPYIRLIHFSGLSLWIGTIVVLDLRLLDLAGRRQTIAKVAEELFPWTWAGFAIAVTGGVLLFSAIAATYIHNPAFQIKLPLLLLGLVYHVRIQRKVRKWNESPSTPMGAKLAGLSELVLWIAVITAGVEIPNN